jgi:hypothetical protein
VKISFFFFLFLSVNLVIAQIPSNCNLPDELRKHYESDVANLAIKWLYTIKSPDTVYFEILVFHQHFFKVPSG